MLVSLGSAEVTVASRLLFQHYGRSVILVETCLLKAVDLLEPQSNSR